MNVTFDGKKAVVVGLVAKEGVDGGILAAIRLEHHGMMLRLVHPTQLIPVDIVGKFTV